MSAFPLEGKKGLADLFSELLILAAQLRNFQDFPNPESLRRRIIEMFETADRRGKEVGISTEALQQARYAVAAFLDEMVLSSPWPDKDFWSARPLQYEFFKDHLAGVEFFNKLETIRRTFPVDFDLLEVYYLCLILGFEGQYKLHGKEKLKEMIEDLSKQLQSKKEGVAFLSPHGKRPDELMETVKQELPSWVVIVSSVALIFFFYIALSLMISHDAGGVAKELQSMIGGAR